MATTWGNVSGNYGRIGIDITTSSTDTKTTVSITTYLWTRYSLQDSNNSYYFDIEATSATTKRNAPEINHTVASGSGWSTQNRTRLGSTTKTYTRGTSDKKYYCAAKMTDLYKVGTVTVSASYTIPKRDSYTVKYNANGGSGAPGSQTKWHSTTLKLSTTKPTRTGYTFKGWATSSSGSVAYAAGANYTANAAVTLYAVWSKITYSVKYNANGGTGAPGTQTKTYGTALTLSSAKPTRSGYDFQGWAASSSGSVAYDPGDSYTANAAVTLYAVWKLSYTPPTITNLKVIRCDASGNVDEANTYAKVTFSWSCDQSAGTNEISSIKIDWGSASDTLSVSGTSGNVSQVIGSGTLDTDTTHTITVTAIDSKAGTTINTESLQTAKFMIDFKAGGTGVAFGKAAQIDGRVEFGIEPQLSNGRRILGTTTSGAELDLLNLNENDNTVLGYGGYNNNIGNTNIYGGNIRLYSKGDIRITAPAQGIDNRNYGENVVLWSGLYYPTKNQTATLSQPISSQPNGIIIVFSKYVSPSALNEQFFMYFVPKRYVLDYSGYGTAMFIGSHWCNASKYVYISDTEIRGNDHNSASRTVDGITETNNFWAMIKVIGI